VRVLIVEDEDDVASLIKRGLERGGDIQAEVVGTGAAALKAAIEAPPDLILLDLNLPFVDGTDVFRVLRSRPSTTGIPVIMLTARSGESDRVSALEAGAVDYITKPFSLRELIARVRTALRRGQEPAPPVPATYQGQHLCVDFDAVAIKVEGKAIRLTRKEFELLKYFVEHRDHVVSRDRLLERVWGFDSEIETVIGLGYRFSEQPES
jgi:DNA-binding response OmpR family regulator